MKNFLDFIKSFFGQLCIFTLIIAGVLKLLAPSPITGEAAVFAIAVWLLGCIFIGAGKDLDL